MSQKYIEVKVSLRYPDFSEYLMAEMAELGFESFVEQEEGFLAYIQGELFDQDAIASLDSFNKACAEMQWSEIAQQNWNEEWEKNFEPVAVGDFCGIRAPFHEAFTNKKFEIIIEPKMSFGTGHHETTALMIELLGQLNVHDKTVLDMGCGTAVLAILTAKMGAAEVTGIDNDEWAFENSKENIQRNFVPDVNILLGDASLLYNYGNEYFDIIIANINRNILLNDIKHYSRVLKQNGILLLSGFYSEDRKILLDHCMQFSLQEERYLSQHNWTAIQLKKI